MKKRGIKLAITAALGLSLILSACTGSKTNDATSDAGIDLSKYPIETDVELTFWCNLPSTLLATTDNLGTTHYSQEYEKRTGVKVKYLHPATGQQQQALNLMVASGELPDMISYTWSWYNGGVERTYSDKVLIDLADILPKYAPNLTAFLKEHPDYDRLVKTDTKRYMYFPTILDGEKLVTTTGPVVRQDWLDKWNIKSPETTEDWTEMLRTFKKNGVEIPMSFTYSNIKHLYSIFGSPYDFYRDENDVIQYGMVSEKFKNALIGIKQWYDEGLLDKNIVSVDSKMIDSYILNGKTGATIASGGSGLGKYIEAAPDKEFNLVGVMFPAEKAGEVSRYNHMASVHGGTGIGITTSCKTPALAAKWLDYVYSEEGRMFANFGIEGVSYEMIDGYPTYTDIITKNPDGKNFSQALTEYTQANGGRGGFIQDERYIEQYYGAPQQQIASREWAKGVKRTQEETEVPYLIYTEEESERHTELYNEIVNYIVGMNVKFFTGVEPIENFDKHVKRVYDMGLQEVLDIENAAYQRFKNR